MSLVPIQEYKTRFGILRGQPRVLDEQIQVAITDYKRTQAEAPTRLVADPIELQPGVDVIPGLPEVPLATGFMAGRGTDGDYHSQIIRSKAVAVAPNVVVPTHTVSDSYGGERTYMDPPLVGSAIKVSSGGIWNRTTWEFVE